MDYQVLLAVLLVVFILAAAFLTSCYTPLPLKTSQTNWPVQVAKWLRVAGMVFDLSFGVLWLCHESIGASETRYFARIILLCSVYLVQTASLLEVARVHSSPEAGAFLVVGLSLIVGFDAASIVLAALPRPPHIIQALSRWLPPSSATCIQLPITVLPVWRTRLEKPTTSIFCWFTAIFTFANLLSIVPFWISVTIRQEREVTVLGCQVSQLVLLSWPRVFSPPMLAQIHMGPDEAWKDFWSRVNWPWQSPTLLQDDEPTLVHRLSGTTSSVWTAGSESVENVSPEGARAWWQVAPSCSANTPSKLGEA